MSRKAKTLTILITLMTLLSSLAWTATDQSNALPSDNFQEDIERDTEGRPVLGGEEETVDTEHFRIHYTREGVNAASTEFVEQTAAALEHSWNVEIEQLGWAAPPPDKGLGGDDRYDVYLLDVEADYLGYVEATEASYVADNPLTTEVETRAYATFMIIDNDYSADEAAGYYSAIDTMRTTVAHEFHHAIQHGYDGDEPASWLMEATSNWVQDEVYDDINDANQDLLVVFKNPGICQIIKGEEGLYENHWYGQWIYLRYISENYGSETIRAMWEYTRELDGYEAMEAALADAGTSLAETLRNFSLALISLDFEEGAENIPSYV